MTHPPADPAFALATSPGAMIAGKYRVQRLIGRGGMGIVLSASHVELAQDVAIKLLLPEAAGDAEGVARFLREGRAAARFTSPHITKVFDVGRLPTGEPFLVMELLRGRDLKNIVDRHGPQPPDVVMRWLVEACEGLAEAHALGIVHRDIKPANLFLAESAGGRHTIKILDFGISKQMHSGEADLTTTSSTMGSPRYMAPEQMRSPKNVDHRVDLWGLGTILYELTTGQPPFVANSLTEVVVEVLHKDPVPPRDLRPSIPKPLADVITRSLQKNPNARFQNASDFARALTLVLGGDTDPLLGLRAPSLVDSSSRPSHAGEVASATMRTWDTTAGSPASSRRGLFITLAGAAAVLGVGLGVALYVWKERAAHENVVTNGVSNAAPSAGALSMAPTPPASVVLDVPPSPGIVAPSAQPVTSSSAAREVAGHGALRPPVLSHPPTAPASAAATATARPSMY